MENEELIRHQMENTRESLTDKLETLENKLLGSVQQATSAVNETVASVKETMNEGMESVKDAVDIPAHVDRHPWLALGGAVLGGFMLGNLLSRTLEPRQYRAAALPAPPTNGSGRQQATPETAIAGASWLSALEPEMQHLKGLALGAALGTLREMLTEEVPPHMADQLRDIIDGVTKKLGGDPLPGSDWDALKSGNSNKPRW